MCPKAAGAAPRRPPQNIEVRHPSINLDLTYRRDPSTRWCGNNPRFRPARAVRVPARLGLCGIAGQSLAEIQEEQAKEQFGGEFKASVLVRV